MRINDRIRVPRVRVIDADGTQVGIIATREAQELAEQQDLDLVEVAPQTDPPVCKIMDYGKYKYEQAVKQREARKKQSHVVVKEMKMRPKIDKHDYETKKGHIVRFLKDGAKVKVTIMFRGREMVHPEIGQRLLRQLAGEVEELAKIETQPKLDGRNMTMVLGPHAVAPQKPAQQKSAPTRVRRSEKAPAADERPRDEEQEKPEEPTQPPRPIKVTRAEGG